MKRFWIAIVRRLPQTLALLAVSSSVGTAQATETVFAVKQISYDGVGRMQCIASRMDPGQWAGQSDACAPQTTGPNGADRIAKNSFDGAGQLTRVQKAYGVAGLQQDYANYTYTLDGKLQTVTDADGNLATFVYDGFDRQVAWLFPSAANGAVNAPCNIGTITEVSGVSGPSETRNASDDCEKYAYDRNSSQATLMKRDGSIVRYSFDNLNRPIVKIVPSRADLSASQTRDVYYGYDLLGHPLTTMFDSASGTEGVTNAYNALGNLTSSSVTMGTFSKSVCSPTQPCLFDSGNNRTKILIDGQAFTYAYDAADRLTTLYEGVGTTTPLDSFAYNADDTLASRKEGPIAVPVGTVSYTWDPIGRLTGQSDAFPSATSSNVSWTFTSTDPLRKVNPSNEIVSETRDNNAYAYGGLVAVSRAYAVNGLNQYKTAGTATFAYDPNGNLTSDGTNTYVYDVENRLVKATAAGLTTNLIYDALGRLFQVDQGSTATATNFLYDGDARVAEYTYSGSTPTLSARYVHGANTEIDDPLVWYTSAALSSKRYLHADHLGSVIAVTNSTGAPSINQYDDYGIPQTDANNVNTNTGHFQYTGQTFIPELGAGLYYYKARMYSAFVGRFLQSDPVGYKNQVNLYEYAGDDPVNGDDPSGLWTCTGAESTIECDAVRQTIAAGWTALRSNNLSKSDAQDLKEILRLFGKEGDKTVNFTFDQKSFDGCSKGHSAGGCTSADKSGNVTVHLRPGFDKQKSSVLLAPTDSRRSRQSDKIERYGTVFHEGRHGVYMHSHQGRSELTTDPRSHGPAFHSEDVIHKAYGTLSDNDLSAGCNYNCY